MPTKPYFVSNMWLFNTLYLLYFKDTNLCFLKCSLLGLHIGFWNGFMVQFMQACQFTHLQNVKNTHLKLIYISLFTIYPLASFEKDFLWHSTGILSYIKSTEAFEMLVHLEKLGCHLGKLKVKGQESSWILIKITMQT